MNRPATQLTTNFVNFARQLQTWLQESKANYTLFIMSIVGILVACFLTWLIIDQHKSQQKRLIDAYGSALNQLATNQLMVSMSNNNLIGLQSTLNDLIDQNKVINAVIYNVDNKIIVQAGDANRLHDTSFKAFTSPITLDDVLLGSLTINVDNSEASNLSLSITLLSLVAAILLLLLFRLTNTVTPQKRTLSQATETNQDSQIESPAFHIETKPNHQALLLIQCYTLEKLYQQLNAEARHLELSKLQSAIKKVLTLYTGQQIAATPNTFLISFEGKDKKDCLLSALYCSYLLMEASRQNQWLVKFSSFIYDKNDSVNIEHLSQLKSLHSGKSDTGMTIKKNTAIENNLIDHLEFSSSTKSDYLFVTGFSNTYESLLKKQLVHIL